MKDYMIPVNVNSRFEFFTGFGMKELGLTCLGIVIGGILSFIAGFILSLLGVGVIPKTVIRLVLITIPSAIMFFGSRRNERTGFSPFDFLKEKKAYRGRQNKYFYVFGSGGGFFERKN